MTERQILPIAAPRDTRREVWALMRPHRAFTLMTLAVLVSATLVSLLGPLVLGDVVDLVVNGEPASKVTTPVIYLIGISIGHGILRAFGEMMVAKLGETVLADLRQQVMNRALQLPLDVIEAAGSGDLASRIGGDVAVIANAVRNVFPTLTGSFLTIFLTIGALASLDWRFALAGLAGSPVQLHTLLWYLKTSTPMFARERVIEGERAQKVLDSIEGAPTVRAFRLQERQAAEVHERSWFSVEFSMLVMLMQTRFFARLNLAEFLGLGTILVTGFFLVRADAVTVGATTAAALYFHRIFNPINNLLGNFHEAQNATSGLARLVGISTMPLPPSPELQARRDASIEVDSVSFSYAAGHEVLHEVSLRIASGERVALVGASGAGKTTLAKIIAGIHEPGAGAIRLGGISLEQLQPGVTGSTVALVTQEVHVFAGTLAADLRLAKPDASDEEIERALDLVAASSWVNALPQGIDTVVGDGGYRLTTSQAQQLALARVALADPPIVILDEATAEAGSAGARVLEKAALAVLQERTSIVVAHRLTQARTADRILMLQDGRLIENGTHDELVAANGAYARLWAAWSDHRTAVEPGLSGAV